MVIFLYGWIHADQITSIGCIYGLSRKYCKHTRSYVDAEKRFNSYLF